MDSQDAFALAESNMPANVFDAETEILMTDSEYNFSVTNPQDMGGSVFYEVRGKDR